uniref:Uncharacterized protein n=1 Tax=Palpitomonas bilix TaxID=652834 RepID=A0A7S3G6Z1_9EUKA|mmetsp:Transcript_26557/g.68143  ORF Transcript_26557/g.68143 Transcript_26557/m.68143 type:complete len:539 (+) Transcript_26557:149-1765(+)
MDPASHSLSEREDTWLAWMDENSFSHSREQGGEVWSVDAKHAPRMRDYFQTRKRSRRDVDSTSFSSHLLSPHQEGREVEMHHVSPPPSLIATPRKRFREEVSVLDTVAPSLQTFTVARTVSVPFSASASASPSSALVAPPPSFCSSPPVSLDARSRGPDLPRPESVGHVPVTAYAPTPQRGKVFVAKLQVPMRPSPRSAYANLEELARCTSEVLSGTQLTHLPCNVPPFFRKGDPVTIMDASDLPKDLLSASHFETGSMHSRIFRSPSKLGRGGSKRGKHVPLSLEMRRILTKMLSNLRDHLTLKPFFTEKDLDHSCAVPFETSPVVVVSVVTRKCWNIDPKKCPSRMHTSNTSYLVLHPEAFSLRCHSTSGKNTFGNIKCVRREVQSNGVSEPVHAFRLRNMFPYSDQALAGQFFSELYQEDELRDQLVRSVFVSPSTSTSTSAPASAVVRDIQQEEQGLCRSDLLKKEVSCVVASPLLENGLERMVTSQVNAYNRELKRSTSTAIAKKTLSSQKEREEKKKMPLSSHAKGKSDRQS